MKTLFSYFQQFSLPKVRKTRLQADFVTNNQILVVKIIKIRPPSYSEPPSRLLRPSPPLPHPVYLGPKSNLYTLALLGFYIYTILLFLALKNENPEAVAQRCSIKNGALRNF